MKQLSIKVNTQDFQIEMKRSGNGKVPPLSPASAATLPMTAFVLIGERSSDMGGGMAGTGYVIQNGKAIYSLAVSASDIRNGVVRLP